MILMGVCFVLLGVNVGLVQPPKVPIVVDVSWTGALMEALRRG